ncbi:HAD family hydrolase [Opitutus terrae]|uniref:Haloacid dehalogenase domain protein hydrolase n=1 Tax=Opitutus terrae (strain DSM 11246 / JCM 15787 / PB90-1) TaxID=452637 RepID=B2A080_OPITP|nr:HAD family hydrolase [Opitutus terrae]ACB77416.1 Haloacid dehalogenase domain protein hydrolase [Opitutus terrae PB90-1]
MPAFGFDLGDTLLEYAGLPLSWVDHYADALHALARVLGVTPTAAEIEAGCGVLRCYNTRLRPREHEVSFARVLAELQPCLGATSAPIDADACAAAFFGVFRQRLRCFPDAPVALDQLRAAGARLGIFTDVPYGMPRLLVMQDVAEAGLTGRFDVLLTSGEAGYRKPAVATLQALATALDCTAAELAYVGNEEKDVAAARRFGCEAILLDRAQRRPAWGQARTITSLLELTEPY